MEQIIPCIVRGLEPVQRGLSGSGELDLYLWVIALLPLSELSFEVSVMPLLSVTAGL